MRKPMSLRRSIGLWTLLGAAALALLPPLLSRAQEPKRAAHTPRSVVLTSNLGQIYERLPKPEADAEVERLLEAAGYSEEFDLLFDLGAFSAPSLQEFDARYLRIPAHLIESSYALGALPLLHRRGLDAAAFSTRELLLPAPAYFGAETGYTAKLASNVRQRGRAAGPFAGREFVELDTRRPLRFGALVPLEPLRLLPEAQGKFVAQVPAFYLREAESDPDRIAPLNETANAGGEPDWSARLGLLVEGSGAGVALAAEAEDGMPFFVKVPLGDELGAGTAVRRGFSSFLNDRLQGTPTVRFAEHVTPDLLKQRGVAFDFFSMLPVWTEEDRAATVGVFGSRARPNQRHLFARAELLVPGGPAEKPERRKVPPGFWIVRRADGTYDIHLDAGFKLGAWTLAQQDFDRVFGPDPTLESFREDLAELGSLRDLLRPVEEAMEVMQQAAEQFLE